MVVNFIIPQKEGIYATSWGKKRGIRGGSHPLDSHDNHNQQPCNGNPKP